MKISVIITVYNLEDFVAAAIQSVLDQTHAASEVIVVDDGSKDNSVNVIEGFGNKVKLVKMEKNSGVLPAFLAGIKASSGNILSFLDGDDTWMPDKLEKVIAIFKQHSDVMMVTHLHEWIDKDGVATGETDETHANLKRIMSVANDEKEIDYLLKNSILCYKGVWLGSAFCISRSDLDLEAYEKWVTSLPGAELSHQDQPLAAYMIYANPGKRIHFINEVLFRYRVYSTNSSGSSTNIPSAIKTINRSIATVSRTRDIVQKKPEWKEENYRQQMKLIELEFYRELYTKRRWKAFSYYLRLISGYWDKHQKIKETKRLVVCLLLGPTKFLHLKTKKRFS